MVDTSVVGDLDTPATVRLFHDLQSDAGNHAVQRMLQSSGVVSVQRDDDDDGQTSDPNAPTSFPGDVSQSTPAGTSTPAAASTPAAPTAAATGVDPSAIAAGAIAGAPVTLPEGLGTGGFSAAESAAPQTLTGLGPQGAGWPIDAIAQGQKGAVTSPPGAAAMDPMANTQPEPMASTQPAPDVGTSASGTATETAAQTGADAAPETLRSAGTTAAESGGSTAESLGSAATETGSAAASGGGGVLNSIESFIGGMTGPVVPPLFEGWLPPEFQDPSYRTHGGGG